MSPAVDPRSAVEVLLGAAGLEVTPPEFETLVAAYPGIRAAVDGLYAVPMDKEEEPQLVFTPLV